jgi:hypothetical protein
MTIKLDKKEIEYIKEHFLYQSEANFNIKLKNKLLKKLDRALKPIKVSSIKLKNKLLKKLDRALKPIKVSSRKAKGRSLQKWVCQRIAKLLNIEYNQQDDQCLIHSREMGQAGVDIILRGDTIKRFPYSIECKNSEQLKLIGTIAQVKKSLIQDTDWLIVHKKKSLDKPIVIMEWDAFEKLNYHLTGVCKMIGDR